MRSFILPCLVVLSACVSPVSDFPAPTQTDSTKSDTTKKTPPPDTTKKTPPDTSHSVTPTASAALGPTAQVVKGWGMYPAGGAGLYGRQQVSNALYASGITFIRVALVPQLYVSGTNVNNIVLDQTQFAILIQALQNGQSYGVSTYIASVWSPPASMKTNGSLNGGSLRTDAESSYVAYLTKIVLSLHSAGMPLPKAISIQNEPEVSAAYSSAVYSVSQWQRVIIAARASFNANGLSAVTLFGPETGEFTQAVWANPSTQTPGYLGGGGFPALATTSLNNAVGAYAFHAYGECELVRVGAGMKAYPRDAWMTEFSAPLGTTELDWTLDTYRALAAHFVVLPFNYWAWWIGWASSSVAPDGGALLAGNTTPIYSKRYWALKQLWTTVRPGWYVTPMTTTDPTLMVAAGNQDPCTVRVDLLAFTSPDHQTVAVLMTNTTTANKVLAVSGLPGTTVQAYRTDASNDMVAQSAVPITSGTANIQLPAGSAVLAVAH
jgi:glucuronoarabinoxylan endo-1,4-beta-xylanase